MGIFTQCSSVASFGVVVLLLGCGSDDKPSASASGGATSGGAAQASGGTSGSGGTAGALPTVSYQRDIAPIFAASCVYCHYTGGVLVDIANPFAPTTGLVNAPNGWAKDHPEGNTATREVAPGDPEHSFLLTKVSDPGLDPATSGAFMPWQVPRLTETELGALRAWISAGANNDATFLAQVRPIFGTPGNLGSAGGKCTFCHYPGGLRPNLGDPFDPRTGAVDVKSALGGGLDLIEPGDPDASFLVTKVSNATLPAAQGAPMPAHFPPLTPAEVGKVRTWISEGALNN
jgi:hypothetical protein